MDEAKKNTSALDVLHDLRLRTREYLAAQTPAAYRTDPGAVQQDLERARERLQEALKRQLPGARGIGCAAHKDGDCVWSGCPQLRDGEPRRSKRHCPLDTSREDEE